MQTLIFDIDGTLTDMSPIEQAVFDMLPAGQLTKSAQRELYRQTFTLLAKQMLLPKPVAYKTVDFIKAHASTYRFAYATGALAIEAKFVLSALGIWDLFDSTRSISRDTCRFSKQTGIPFRRLAKFFPGSIVITDSHADEIGAQKAGLQCIVLAPNAAFSDIPASLTSPQ